jgi:hypothetical protein
VSGGRAERAADGRGARAARAAHSGAEMVSAESAVLTMRISSSVAARFFSPPAR